MQNICRATPLLQLNVCCCLLLTLLGMGEKYAKGTIARGDLKVWKMDFAKQAKKRLAVAKRPAALKREGVPSIRAAETDAAENGEEPSEEEVS